MSRALDTAKSQQSNSGPIPPFVAGKNKIINGDFSIWQRGTSFSNPTNGTYTTDRWRWTGDGTGATRTVSRQAFTPGTAPVAGYENTYFLRHAVTVASTNGSYNGFQTRIEDVRSFAGQTVTLSFWAKANTASTLFQNNTQNFGSGGSSSVTFPDPSSEISITTSWARYSVNINVPSISGKTIGSTSGYLQIYFGCPINVTQEVDFWGVQLEAGSTATPFQTATGTIQGELAACQRYYWRFIDGVSQWVNMAAMFNAGQLEFAFRYVVPMRVAPTLIASTGTSEWNFSRNGASDPFNSLTLYQATTQSCLIYNNSEISGTAGHAGNVYSNQATSSAALSAEL